MTVIPYHREPDVPRAWVELMPSAVELAKAVANTGFVPKAFRGNPAEITAAILYGDEVGLGPLQSLAKISVIEGKPTLAAEAQRALILAAGHEFWIEEATTTRVTVAGRRKNSDRAAAITWTIDDAKRAGLAGRQNWRTYPRQMLLARASAELARAIFSDVIGGLAATEELETGEGAPTSGPAAPPNDAQTGPTTPSQRRKRPARTAPPPVIAPAGPAPEEPPVPPLPDDYPEPKAKASEPQMKKLMALFRERGMADRDDRLDWTNRHLDRTIVSASELTDAEASKLIDALEADEPKAEVAEGQMEIAGESEPLITSERLDVLMWLRRESGVTDDWIRAQLAGLGVADLPKRIGRDDLKRLTRSEAMVLSDALSTQVDARTDS